MDEFKLLAKIRENSTAPNKKATAKSQTFSVKRDTNLIVPKVTYQNNTGDLHNGHWAYNVSYAFREALDMSYDTRQNQVKFSDINTREIQKRIDYFQVWTQGCLINFVTGDRFTSLKGYPCLQVIDAKPVSLDSKIGSWDEGFVVYSFFDQIGKPNVTLSQMDFLKILIYGT